MSDYALLIDGGFREIRRLGVRPADIPHKGISWHDVVYREGATWFSGLEDGVWVVQSGSAAPQPPPVPESITRRQCALRLLAMGLIAPQEALAMAKDGTPPAAVEAVLAGMPSDQAILARIDFAATSYARGNPLIAVMMQASGMTAAQVDRFFVAAAAL